LTLGGIPAFAQDRIVEGEYQIQPSPHSGASEAKTVTRWILYGTFSGHLRLESEIQGQPIGMRLVQIEELNDHLMPVSIGYELYREAQSAPSTTATCDFSQRNGCV
jgi:hypothetical protein